MPRIVDRAIAGSVRLMPRGLVQRVSRRYIAGQTMGEALAVVARLANERCRATVDVLGEHVTSREQCVATRDQYLNLLNRLQAERLPAGVSVKPTAMGLGLDRGFCLANLRDVARAAAAGGRFMRVDMEESTWTSATIDLILELHAAHANVGAVVQARLRRSRGDVQALAERQISVRLCKGIYHESPEIALQDFSDIRGSYLEILDTLLSAGCYVGLATHDKGLVERALEMMKRHHVDQGRYEFQMLMGVAEPLRRRLVGEGHKMRVYVPYGSDWYGYSTRRLQENPQMATAIALALLRP
ncbi:MAG: proline dehydrogenase family protein [Candidatus Dormibacteraeota bacterium]|nr:proline dehydrogenase family protein [Candidatus Dormibacteraeota bacterium]